ncbi:MAG: hypothetical protein MJE68_28870 [Proteobacteria bacterium]|nr:hypothetical protein [Pseudomonadota bacterium]
MPNMPRGDTGKTYAQLGKSADLIQIHHEETIAVQRKIVWATRWYAFAALATLGFFIYEYNFPRDFLSDVMPSMIAMFREALTEVLTANAMQTIPDCACPPLVDETINATN